MILSGEDLINRVMQDQIFEHNEWKNFNGWQFDLNLGDQAFITGRNKPIILELGDYLTIRPGEFALLLTDESIKMPWNLMAFIAVRFTFKKMGLLNISGFHVDPGYVGKLIFSVYNAGPNDIIMQQGMPVFMIFFSEITKNTQEYATAIESGSTSLPPEIQDFKQTIVDGLNKKSTPYNSIPLDMMTSIQGTSVSLSQNNSRIERLENNIKIYGSIAVAIIISLIGVILTGGR